MSPNVIGFDPGISPAYLQCGQQTHNYSHPLVSGPPSPAPEHSQNTSCIPSLSKTKVELSFGNFYLHYDLLTIVKGQKISSTTLAQFAWILD